ncbi:MAG: radical SAM protein [Spirochaetes bacterium]|nr:radical SAM protein [Spirochaetota bacterium]
MFSFSKTDALDLNPFEICSIRPPTENLSLTFRLTRNCYWNKCAFCPVYKCGAKFSRRTVDEVIEDVQRAKRIDDFLFEHGIGYPVYSEADFYKLQGIVQDVQRQRWEAGIVDVASVDTSDEKSPMNVDDERMQWFMQWFVEKPTLAQCFEHIVQWRIGGSKTCFLGDADGLIVHANDYEKLLSIIKQNFPTLERFTIYGRTKTARKKDFKELSCIQKAGINRVHFGLESGSDEVLKLVNKGEDSRDHVEGCIKAKDAGLSVSVYIMPGLGGRRLSHTHAHQTARVINAIKPEYVRLRTLSVFPYTPLSDMVKSGQFELCTDDEIVDEIEMLITQIEVPVMLYSDSATNLLPLHGQLPHEKDQLLSIIGEYKSKDYAERLQYRLRARLESFVGQYGRLTDDIDELLQPLIKGNRLAIDNTEYAENVITAIYNKLMP